MDLQFSGNDPGAVTFGNFINYYEFHPPEERLKLLPNHLWESRGNKYTCLDVGCNTGELTVRLFESITNSLKTGEVSSGGLNVPCVMLGIDIDPILIERAQETNKYTDQVTFKCLDFMSDESAKICEQYFPTSGGLIDVIFCFSVSMWIHLNHGDEGLQKFLKDISEMGKMVVIEPQPWKCYKSAVKRLKRCQKSFKHFESIKIQKNVEQFIEEYLINSCNFVKVYESMGSQWGRRILCFKRNIKNTLEDDCQSSK